MARLPNTAPPATTSARRDVPRSGNTASEPASVATFTMTACAVPSAPWRDSPRSKVQPFAEKLMSSVLGIAATSTQHDDVTVSNRDLAVRATHGRAFHFLPPGGGMQGVPVDGGRQQKRGAVVRRPALRGGSVGGLDTLFEILEVVGALRLDQRRQPASGPQPIQHLLLFGRGLRLLEAARNHAEALRRSSITSVRRPCRKAALRLTEAGLMPSSAASWPTSFLGAPA